MILKDVKSNYNKNGSAMMTEKRYKSIGTNLECPNGMEYMLIKRNDGVNVCQVCSKYTAKEIVDELNSLADENEQLKKDATTLIYANQDYRQQNLNLQEELDYIQNSITNAIKHQKTELGVKALQEIIADYNEWMLGHKEAKE